MNILFLISCVCDVCVLALIVILFTTTLIMFEGLRRMTEENNKEIHLQNKKLSDWKDMGNYDEL